MLTPDIIVLTSHSTSRLSQTDRQTDHVTPVAIGRTSPASHYLLKLNNSTNRQRDHITSVAIGRTSVTAGLTSQSLPARTLRWWSSAPRVAGTTSCTWSGTARTSASGLLLPGTAPWCPAPADIFNISPHHLQPHNYYYYTHVRTRTRTRTHTHTALFTEYLQS